MTANIGTRCRSSSPPRPTPRSAGTLASLNGTHDRPEPVPIPSELAQHRRARPGPQQHPLLDPDRRPPGRRRRRGGPVLDRGRRAEGADRPQRRDATEGRRHPQGGLHGADRRPAALEPARASARPAAIVDPRGPDRGRRSRSTPTTTPRCRPGRSSSTATSNGPTGPVVVSSQLVPLTVAEKFLTLEFQRVAAEQGTERPPAGQGQQAHRLRGRGRRHPRRPAQRRRRPSRRRSPRTPPS